MITEQQEELAALYAFDLLEGAERTEFESAVAASRELRALVDSLRETAALAALSAPQMEPPAGLKDRIMAIAAETAAEEKVVPFSLFKLMPWAIAAGLAVAATWLGTQNFSLRAENSNLLTERQLAETAYKMAQDKLTEHSLVAEKMITDLGNKLLKSEDLARLKVTALASLAGNTKAAQVIAVWDPEQQSGLLAMDKLPPIGDTQDYQIWVVDPAYKDPVNAGVFHVSSDGRVAIPFKPDEPVAHAAAFAISLEKKGGVPKAEGTIVLLGK
ncbi:MAG: anti-sigma factor [Lacunisphaera sp.]